MEMTIDALTKTLTTSVADGVAAALKAANTVTDDQRPAAPAVKNVAVNRGRYAPPRVGVAMKALGKGQWRSSEALEKDISQAAAELWGYRSREDDDPSDPIIEQFGATKSSRSVIWPKSSAEMSEVLFAMGERQWGEHGERIDSAIRAMTEASTVSITANTAGGVLVPPQFLQDQFAYALVSTVALRQVPGVQTMPVTSPIVLLPRESVTAGASQANEAGTLSAQDATFAQQQIAVKKQYGYRLYSNELLADATPAWNEFLARTLVRDVGLQQDAQFLDGSGSGAQITGLIGYSGLTTGPNLGTNGGSPTYDNLFDAQYNLRAVNAEPDFLICHPRVLNSLMKVKDSTGNYILSNVGGAGVPMSYGTGLPGAGSKATLLGSIGTYFSSQLNIARTVGTSTDCTTAILGASNQVLILERSGIEIAYSEHIAFNTDQSAVRAIGRAAVAILQPSAVELITGIRP